MRVRVIRLCCKKGTGGKRIIYTRSFFTERFDRERAACAEGGGARDTRKNVEPNDDNRGLRNTFDIIIIIFRDPIPDCASLL